MKFISLTTKENKQIQVNLAQIAYLEQLENETLIHFGTKEVAVLEKVTEILAACPKTEEVKETEDFEAVKSNKTETPVANPFHKYKAE